MTPPKAKRIEKKLPSKFEERVDYYYWLRKKNSKEVRAYLEKENRYTEKVMKDTLTLQKELFKEMKSRYAPSDESVPYYFEGYWYSLQYRKGEEHPIFVRREKEKDKKFEVLLEVSPLAKDKDFFEVDRISVSPSGKMLAYSWDDKAETSYTISFKDLETGELLKDTLSFTSGKLVWASDNRHVFYVQLDPYYRAFQVKRHLLGTSVESDVVIFEEKDKAFDLHISKTKSQEYFLLLSSSTLSDECWYLSCEDPLGEFTLVQAREKDLEYSIEHFQDSFYLITNQGGAKNFKLMKTPIHSPSKKNWEEVIPHREEVLLEGFELFQDFLVLEERIEGLLQIQIIELKTSKSHYLEFEDPTYCAYLSLNMEFETSLLRYSYSSLAKPAGAYSYDMHTRKTELIKAQQVMDEEFSPRDYITQRIWATSRDEKKIPVSLVYHKDTKPSIETPLLLYGYGSYGHTVDAHFSSVRLSLLERGFIYAIAHVRGGEYLGREWYEEGKMLSKKNTFYDFIDVAKHLIEEKYTSSRHLYAMGGSAGGLLVGAVINMEPQLFHGAIAQVPFVDVLTTMLDKRIPLTAGEYDEWGDPSDPKYYEYIKSYSPYDNVTQKDYPHLLVTTGLSDMQVPYWEPCKWVAKLRHESTSSNLLLLKCDFKNGHHGASGRFESLKEEALELAFLLKLEDRL